MPLAPELESLLATRREGHGMPRDFYRTEALYAAELQCIWQAGWLFAGFEVELPEPGDFITLAVDSTPVLVLRGDDGALRAFHNVCRHRGTQLCREERGHLRSIVSARTTRGPMRATASYGPATACTTASTSRSSA
jgi:Rieske 2Fe-2S family protein